MIFISEDFFLSLINFLFYKIYIYINDRVLLMIKSVKSFDNNRLLYVFKL